MLMPGARNVSCHLVRQGKHSCVCAKWNTFPPNFSRTYVACLVSSSLGFSTLAVVGGKVDLNCLLTFAFLCSSQRTENVSFSSSKWTVDDFDCLEDSNNSLLSMHASVFSGINKHTGDPVSFHLLHSSHMDSNLYEALLEIRHPHVVEALSAGVKTNGFLKDQFVVITASCHGQLLSDVMAQYPNGLDESNYIRLLTSLISAIEHVQSKCIYLTYFDSNCIVCTSNSSQVMSFQLAPFNSICSDFSRKEEFDADVNVWSLGAILYKAATGDEIIHVMDQLNTLQDLHQLVAEGCKLMQPGSIHMEYLDGRWEEHSALPKNINMSESSRQWLTPLLVGLLSKHESSRWCLQQVKTYVEEHIRTKISAMEIYRCDSTPEGTSPKLFRMISQSLDQHCIRVVELECRNGFSEVILHYEHSWPSLDDAFWKDLIPDDYLDDPDWFIPHYSFSTSTPSSHEIDMLMFDNEEASIKVISLNNGKLISHSEMPLQQQQMKYKTKFFHLTSSTFVRVGYERQSQQYRMDLNTFQHDDQHSWTATNVLSYPSNTSVKQCKMCGCGRVFAFTCADEGEELNIVAIQRGELIKKFRCNPYKSSIAFHHGTDDVCRLVLVQDGDNEYERWLQLFVINEDFYLASSSCLYSSCLSMDEGQFQLTFSQCGRYLLTRNQHPPVWSTYQLDVNQIPLECSMLLLNEFQSSSPFLLFSEKFVMNYVNVH